MVTDMRAWVALPVVEALHVLRSEHGSARIFAHENGVWRIPSEEKDSLPKNRGKEEEEDPPGVENATWETMDRPTPLAEWSEKRRCLIA